MLHDITNNQYNYICCSPLDFNIQNTPPCYMLQTHATLYTVENSVTPGYARSETDKIAFQHR